jgi:uncharacterized protein YkwD
MFAPCGHHCRSARDEIDRRAAGLQPQYGVDVGLESRDWYRDEYRKQRKPRVSRWLIAGLVIGALGLVAVSPPVSDRLGYEPPLGIGTFFDREPDSISHRLLPGGPAITTYKRPLYARNDPWKAWLAPESSCPGGERTTGPAATQNRTMLCLLNYARRHQGLRPLRSSALLAKTARSKAADIVRCGEFAHEACRLPANHAALAAGYRGPFGENLYIAEGRYVSPRVAVDQWLNSPGHRTNLFQPQWRTVGIALRRRADVERFDDAVIWVNQFGDG